MVNAKRMLALKRLTGVLVCAASLLVCGQARAQEASRAVKLNVDLSDAARRIYHAKIEFPAKAGPLTLVYPKWIPGEHGPTGPISDLTGLHFRVAGKDIPWKRDDVDLYAFHCEVPPGAAELDVTLDYLLPAEEGAQGVPSASDKVAVLPWNLVVLYPKGTKSDDVMFSASLRVPAGWKFATALPIVKSSGDETEFGTVSLTTLVDSPVLAGEYFRTYDLSPGQKPEHRLDVAADSAAAAQATPDEILHLRQLVAETGALFGARHYRHYDFLLALSDHLEPNGLEHHESSDNRGPERMLLDPDILESLMDLLPHEFFHSWNGKYRRPAGLATPNYQEPMKGDLLWVYEGFTQYYGTMLAARSGFWTPHMLRENLASVAAYLNNRPGRSWRDLEDTAISAQILYFARKEGSSWRRGVDYYDESTLIWLEADTIIRRETHEKKSLDDFCRLFYGGENTGPELVTYTFDDVVAALNQVAPYDWKTFFNERLYSHGPGAPLGGLESSGWRLTFSEAMNEHQRAMEQVNQETDVQFSLGMIVHNPGAEDSNEVEDVIPGSPAAKAGVAPDMKLLAVNGRRWTPEILREAIRQAKDTKEPIELLVENDGYFKTVKVDYHGGERYPHLEAQGRDVLEQIAQRKAEEVK
jgi:predicted metalloprotease with PDZ domain